jgi:signal transduction histidine kinase/ActR/RegA family two-component response regulator
VSLDVRETRRTPGRTYSDEVDQGSLEVMAQVISRTPAPAVIDHVVRDGDGRPVGVTVDYANAAATRLFLGREPTRSVTYVGVDLLDVLPGEAGRTSVDATIRTAREGRAVVGEWEGSVPSGFVHLRFVQAPLSGDYVITWFDENAVSQAADLEHDLLVRRKADLRLALEASEDGLVILRPVLADDDTTAYRVDLANRSACELEPVLGTELVLGHHTPDFAPVASLLDRARMMGDRQTGVRWRSHTSQQVLALSVDPIDDGRLLLTARDVTEQVLVERRAAEASAMSARRLNLMVRSFDAIPEAIAVFRFAPDELVNAGGSLTLALELVNEAGARVPGDRDRDMNRSVDVAWPFARSSGLVTVMEQVALSGDTRALELPAVEFRGDELNYQAIVARLDEASLLVVLVDVTELRRASAGLVAAQAREVESVHSRGLLVEAIAHELRTPLTTVIAVTDLLVDSGLTDEQRGMVDHQRVAARAMLSLVNDTLDLRRLEAGSALEEGSAFDSRHLLADVVTLLEPQARAQGVSLRCVVDDSVPELLWGRGSLIQQVLVNLGGNALKFTAEGSVELRASARGTSGERDGLLLVLEVIDTGRGIEPEHMASIFQRFQQGDRAIRRQHGGSGLGLAIVRGIVEALQGDLQVDSQPGAGTTFTVSLPVGRALPDAQTPIEAVPRADDAAGAPLRVLLAEDEDVNRVFVAALLEKLGAEVDTAVDGVEALDAFLSGHYDLVLLDVQMPRRDGIEAVTALRAEEQRLGRVPTRVLALTASPTAQVRTDCTAAGMDGVLGKPIALDELSAALDEVRGRLVAVVAP